MDVRVLAIVEVRVRPPDALQHLDAQRQRLHRAAELQSRVAPVLPKVAVHRVVHVQLGYGAHAADDHVRFDDRRHTLAVRRQMRLLVALEQILEQKRDVLAEQLGVDELLRLRLALLQRCAVVERIAGQPRHNGQSDERRVGNGGGGWRCGRCGCCCWRWQLLAAGSGRLADNGAVGQDEAMMSGVGNFIRALGQVECVSEVIYRVQCVRADVCAGIVR